MTHASELGRLEEFVQKLLVSYRDLQDKNQRLGEEIRQHVGKIEALEHTIETMTDERGEISNRVSNLIGQIEEWESTQLDGDAPDQDAPDQDAPAAEEYSVTAHEPDEVYGSDSQELQDAEEYDELSTDDENQESRIQGSLFTVER